MNRTTVLLPIASIGGDGLAMRYRELLVAALADFARVRPPCDFHSALSEVREGDRRSLSRDNAQLDVRFSAPLNAESTTRHLKVPPSPKDRNPREKAPRERRRQNDPD